MEEKSFGVNEGVSEFGRLTSPNPRDQEFLYEMVSFVKENYTR